MRRTPGSGTVYYHKNRQIWVAELQWGGKRHVARSAQSRYDAHVALSELRRLRDAEQVKPRVYTDDDFQVWTDH
jgi:hypothetical protein